MHATGERNLGRLGGLIHRMPWVAWLTLIGALAIAGLPPLNGFVSEWLLLQAFLFSHEVPHSFVNMLLPLGAGLVALVAALAGYVMVKFFGIIFLGQPRESGLAQAQDPGLLERAGSRGSQSSASRSVSRRSRSSARSLASANSCISARSRRPAPRGGCSCRSATARLPTPRSASCC
jgi:NADH:ubiquinone oxidoreductase subunit 5 (subunit L)/multisubunit Na+/H+ antiporter MnhA subunit